MRRGGLIVGTKDGVGYLDTATDLFEPVADPEAEMPDRRINDAKVDRAGRFWFGTMQDEGLEPVGALYRLDPDRSVTRLDEGYSIPNGFAWSTDDRRLYVANTKLGTIFVYDFDLETGRIANRRVFAELAAGEGTPDGATVDAEGYLWSARTGGACVARYDPDGRVERILPLPVSRPTSVTFGGPELRTLFVTTASRGLSEAELAGQPLAGAVLACEVDVPGLAEPLFAG